MANYEFLLLYIQIVRSLTSAKKKESEETL